MTLLVNHVEFGLVATLPNGEYTFLAQETLLEAGDASKRYKIDKVTVRYEEGFQSENPTEAFVVYQANRGTSPRYHSFGTLEEAVRDFGTRLRTA